MTSRRLAAAVSICLKCSWPLLFASFLSEPSAQTETSSVLKESVTAEISGFKFRVLFENGDLEKETKRIIHDDFRTVYGHLPMYEVRIPNTRRTFQIDGRAVPVTKIIDFVGGHRDRPNQLENQFGRIVTVEEIDYLVVPVALSDAYKKALAFIEKNRTVYTKLQAFEKFMNNLKPGAVPAWEDLFYLHAKNDPGWSKDVKENDLQQFASKHGEWSYQLPSLFSFQKGLSGGSSLDNEFIAHLRIFNTKGKFPPSIPLIYHEGRWKLLLIIPGT